MTSPTTSLFRLNRAPALAAAFVICLSLAPNTLARATNTLQDVKDGLATSTPIHENGEVLTHEDAVLYRAIFTAQAQGHWNDADTMIAKLGDKRLMGHVLADRYQRRVATLPELQSWLAAYHDLPEAEDIYQQARKLPGAKKAKLATPLPTANLSGHSYSYETASGFRSKARPAVKLSAAARQVANRVEAALRGGNPEKAKELLQANLQGIALPLDEVVALQARLASNFFYNDDAEEALHLTDVSYMQDDARAEWINGLSNYKQGTYATAANAFVTLADRDDLSDGDHAAAAFWAYRALKHSGATDEANRWLKEAANQHHSFYGMLANTLAGGTSETSWSWQIPELNQHAVETLAAHPAGGRALALAQIGQNDLAESELMHLNPQGHHALQQAILAMADKEHMASLALKVGGMTVNDQGKPYDAALYPLPAWQPKGGFHVERALLYALMRHESQFDPMAVSSQGACGLMQLMPATAERMSGTTHTNVNGGECPDQFFDPATNLGLGQNYVRQLASQPMIGDNLLLLLTAYNGGPSHLSERSNIDASDDPLLFMESLPVQETHDYLQQVMIQYWTYRARLHQPLKSLDQLAHGEWPRYALRDLPPVREASSVDSLIGDTGFAVASNQTVH